MNPMEQMLMAARGHQGLPMQIGGPSDDAGPPAGMPPAVSTDGPPAAPSGGGGSDRDVADTAAQQLLAATHQASDPELKASLATALAALHKYIVGVEKEHHQAMAGKFSPRMMAQGR